jgi:hypothetical protein
VPRVRGGVVMEEAEEVGEVFDTEVCVLHASDPARSLLVRQMLFPAIEYPKSGYHVRASLSVSPNGLARSRPTAPVPFLLPA